MKSFLQSREILLAFLLVAAFFLINFSIASRSPYGAWMDEVTYVDPGLNLASGKGWQSSAWPWETDREFYAESPPLYPAGLSLWVRVFGISMEASRAYCYLLGAIGTLLFWLGAYRFKLLTPGFRLFWIVLLSTEYGMNWMQRNERYDVWIYVGIALAWVGASLQGSRVKYPLIGTGCFIIPFAGFIGVPYVFLIAGIVTVLTKFLYWKEAVVAMVTAVLGVLGVFGFFFAAGHLETFWYAVHHLTADTTTFSSSKLSKIILYSLDDKGLCLMIAAWLLLTLYVGISRQLTPGLKIWLIFGWSVLVLMPAIMTLRGIFVMMYFYMVIIPLSLAILEVARQLLAQKPGRYFAVIALFLLGVTCFSGLPSRAYFSYREWNFRDPQHIREFVRTYLRPDDSVYSSNLFYFELRDYVKFQSTLSYVRAIPATEADQINVVLVDQNDLNVMKANAASFTPTGAAWKKVADFPTPEMMAHLPAGMSPGQVTTYTLYRRDLASP